MTPRATFLTGAAIGASFAAGVLVDAVCDVTGLVARALAPVERWLYPRRAATFGVLPDPHGWTYFFDNGHAYELPRPGIPGIPVCPRCNEDADLCDHHVGPCTGQLRDLSEETP